MGGVSVSTAAAILLVVVAARGRHVVQDCDSGPPPPGDLGFFLWVNSGFEPPGDVEKNAAETHLGEADFLCQRRLNFANFTTIIPLSEVDFSTSCSVPIKEASCNLLSSCSPENHGGRRRLTQQCVPFFGCQYLVTVGAPADPPKLADGEIPMMPPNINQTVSLDVALGICFEGSCVIIAISDRTSTRDRLGALAYGMCPEKYAMETVDGWTTLHWAATIGEASAPVDALVENGADLEARDADGFTPMHVASKWGIPAYLLAFINLGADLEAKDRRGNTPLVLASVFGRDGAIKVLLEAGANPNMRYFTDENSLLASKTPLHFASLYHRKTKIVEMLIQAGADVKSVDDTGNTPLQIAERYGRVEIIRILKKHGAR